MNSGSSERRSGRAIDILRELVAIESVNPYFPGGEQAEVKMSEYLGDFFRGLGLTPHFQEVLPGRANTWAALETPRARPDLAIRGPHGHRNSGAGRRPIAPA